MQVFRDHHHRDLCPSSSVAIGNFDGVHRGHQALLRQARALAAEAPAGHNGSAVANTQLAVVTFEPLPRAFFDPATAPARLGGPAEKLRLLRAEGVDLTWMLRFNGALASMSPEDFVTQVLVRGLHARAVVIGRDFRFGKARAGDLALMRALGARHGFSVSAVDDVLARSERISSTALRAALARGDFAAAEQLLGRPYTLRGRVVRGARLGRSLGYPTANIRPWRGSTPLHGVYAVRARQLGDRPGPWRDGVASVGVRPAVGGGETLLEVHLFDFTGNLYGQKLETQFVARLRGEEDFADLDALVAQMNIDARGAREHLAATLPRS